MKNYIFAANLLVLGLLISSCGDILNPEPDTSNTQIKYHVVLKDQEHSVIMPLKVGNMWVYKVSDVSYEGKTEFKGYDTILVKRDTIIKGEKWFIAKDPSSNSKEVVFTNTDVGLICNPECFCGLLRAEYPANYMTYLYLKNIYPDQIRYYDDQGKMIDQKIVYRDAYFWVNVEIKIYEIFNISSDCFIYNIRAEYNQDGKTLTITKFSPYIEYFIPNLGLVRKDFFTDNTHNDSYIFKRMELIYTNVKS